MMLKRKKRLCYNHTIKPYTNNLVRNKKRQVFARIKIITTFAKKHFIMYRIHFLFVVFFSFATSSIYAQLVISNFHTLRPDTLQGMLYSFTYEGAAGKDVVWDFRSLTEPHEMTRYISLISPDDSLQLCVHEHHTRTFYKMQEDTLFCTGYENALTRMEYSCSEPILRFPLGYGDMLSGMFAGTGEYCHRLPFTVNGYTHTQVDGIGTLLLPDMQVKKVLRVHRCRVWTEVAGSETNMQEDVWQWYAPQCPYPLLEALRLTQRAEEMDSVLLSSICLFPFVTDEDNDNHSLQDKETDDKVSEHLLSEASFLPNPVQTALQISYRLATDAEVYVSVHYGGGVCMYRTPVIKEAEGVHSLSLDMSAFPIGNYVLYLHADTETLSETVIKL